MFSNKNETIKRIKGNKKGKGEKRSKERRKGNQWIEEKKGENKANKTETKR